MASAGGGGGGGRSSFAKASLPRRPSGGQAQLPTVSATSRTSNAQRLSHPNVAPVSPKSPTSPMSPTSTASIEAKFRDIVEQQVRQLTVTLEKAIDKSSAETNARLEQAEQRWAQRFAQELAHSGAHAAGGQQVAESAVALVSGLRQEVDQQMQHLIRVGDQKIEAALGEFANSVLAETDNRMANHNSQVLEKIQREMASHREDVGTSTEKALGELCSALKQQQETDMQGMQAHVDTEHRRMRDSHAEHHQAAAPQAAAPHAAATALPTQTAAISPEALFRLEQQVSSLQQQIMDMEATIMKHPRQDHSSSAARKHPVTASRLHEPPRCQKKLHADPRRISYDSNFSGSDREEEHSGLTYGAPPAPVDLAPMRGNASRHQDARRESSPEAESRPFVEQGRTKKLHADPRRISYASESSSDGEKGPPKGGSATRVRKRDLLAEKVLPGGRPPRFSVASLKKIMVAPGLQHDPNVQAKRVNLVQEAMAAHHPEGASGAPPSPPSTSPRRSLENQPSHVPEDVPTLPPFLDKETMKLREELIERAINTYQGDKEKNKLTVPSNSMNPRSKSRPNHRATTVGVPAVELITAAAVTTDVVGKLQLPSQSQKNYAPMRATVHVALRSSPSF